MQLVSKVYLAGPMTGIEKFNYPAFNDMAERLRDGGIEVFNPAESFGGDTTREYHEYMRHNIREMLSCRSIAFLPGWQKSRGCKLELAIAEALFLPAVGIVPDGYVGWTLHDIHETGSILDEAKSLVHGSRQQDYGHPKENWQRIAALASVIVGVDVSPLKAILIAEAFKISRLCHGYKRDSAVDIAGYAEVMDIVCGT